MNIIKSIFNRKPSFENELKKQLSTTAAKKMTIELARLTQDLTKKDVGLWRDAWQSAIDVENPQRADLYAIYDDIMIDNHLYGAIRNRMLQTMRRKFKLVHKETGEENSDLTKLFEKKWFRNFVRLSLEAKFYGHSLIQINDLVNGEIHSITLVPRAHVIPEKGIFVREVGDEEGWSYREGVYANWCIEVGEPDDLGILNKVAPQAIGKRNIIIFWDEFGEMFAIPIRIGKSTSRDKKEHSKIETMLKEMGTSAWALFPTGTEVEIVESKNKDSYQVFDKRVDRANSEMSKAVNGQTMTMDDGASNKQGEVHERVAEDIVESDGVDVLYEINDDLIPKMVELGYPAELANYEFAWDDSRELSLKEQQEIDAWLIQHFDIELDYFTEKYNSRITGFKKFQPIAPGGGEEQPGK